MALTRFFNRSIFRRPSSWVLVLILLIGLAFMVIDRLVMPFLVRHGKDTQVPNILGLAYDVAERSLIGQKLGLRVVAREYHSEQPEGTVVSQEPLVGAIVKQGRVVKVVLSRGGETTVVPWLCGKTLRQAQIALLDAGLALAQVGDSASDSLPPGLIVTSQPPAGTIVRLGTAVKLIINQIAKVDSLLMPRFVGKSLPEVQVLAEEIGLRFGTIKWQKNDKLLPGTVLSQSPLEGDLVAKGTLIDIVVTKTD